MYPADDDASARAQAQYERTSDLIRGMAEAFHDLWTYAENRAAVKTTDGTVYGVSEITEAIRDPLGLIWLTFTLLDADEGDIASFDTLASPANSVVLRARAVGSITLRYDLITAILVDEEEPEEDDEDEDDEEEV